MAAGKDTKLSKPLPPPNTDFYQLAETLPPEELTILKQVLCVMLVVGNPGVSQTDWNVLTGLRLEASQA